MAILRTKRRAIEKQCVGVNNMFESIRLENCIERVKKLIFEFSR